MNTINSFLQKVFQMVKNLAVKVTKRMYRQAAVFITGVAVMTVIMLTSNQFGGGGKNALAFADTKIHETDESSEEIELDAELNVQSTEVDYSVKQGQAIVGEQFEKMLLERQAEDNNIALSDMNQSGELLVEVPAAAAAEPAVAELVNQVSDPYYGLSKEDYDVLLHIVQAEAGICDDKGKILVANVILNRIDSSQFPDNVTDVVYQKSQFSPVSDGSINRVKVTDQTIDCVNRALQGEDYSQGALYFMNRSGSYSHAVRWFDGKLTFLFQHERHEFFK